ncbi:Hsp33 family molecular chaperone HslO [Teredinibacter waterburyi]|jgi:Disulfide bond chaperones of the HSP33 family|uniref:Hsp33 family molecular chaperone HslO n=1 Tax=Teredinibacter waterburyi TaxID=1500538 RepID=UPI00165F7842|nr:Hsp33 family molecular chaperone HslO [Teredinibacter waterburyi]
MSEHHVFDCTHRFIFDDTDVRGELVTLRTSYQKAMAHQQIPTSLKPLLGQFFAAISLLSETLKFDGVLTLQARGDGAVPLIMAEANNRGDLRGILRHSESFTNEQLELLGTEKSFKELLGNGFLTITVDPSQGERYQGVVPLDGETLAACLSSYFVQSEQLPTKLWLFASEFVCGGLMLQSLPAQKIKDLDQRGEVWATAVNLAATLTHDELFSLPRDALLYRLFNELKCRLYPARELQFRCSCSRERSANALISLGRSDAESMLEEKGKIAVDCQFCGQHYAFASEDMDSIFGEKDQPLH